MGCPLNNTSIPNNCKWNLVPTIKNTVNMLVVLMGEIKAYVEKL